MDNNGKKCLYYQRFYQTINGDSSPICRDQLRYGIMPQNEKKEYKTFDELWENKSGLRCYGREYKKLFGKGQVRKIYYSASYGFRDKCVKESNFENAAFEIEYDECTADFSIDTLSKSLTADMFFDYYKDNIQKRGMVDGNGQTDIYS